MYVGHGILWLCVKMARLIAETDVIGMILLGRGGRPGEVVDDDIPPVKVRSCNCANQ